VLDLGTLNGHATTDVVYPLDTRRVCRPGRLHVLDAQLNVVALPARGEKLREPRIVVRTGLRREPGCVYTLGPTGIRCVRPRGS
jgi:hypothetical protein